MATIVDTIGGAIVLAVIATIVIGAIAGGRTEPETPYDAQVAGMRAIRRWLKSRW